MDKFKLLPDFKVNFITKAMSETMSYGIKLHNIPEMWKSTKGEGVKVGVIDTGLPIHNDLKNQIAESANFTSDPIADLVVGHSTHVAGVILAEENGEGVVGIAPKSRLYIAKGLDDQGSGTDESLAKAVDWCVEKGVDIINMSLGAPGIYDKFFPKTKEAIQKAYKKNITIICAAGNEDASMVGFPASMPETISVAAINSEKQRANFSNKGSKNDFAAAGVDIMSTYINNTFASLSGTCLVGDTKVLTSNGPKNIKDMEIGDMVYSVDETSDKICLNKCVNVLSNGTKQVYELKTKNQTILTTSNHPFLVIYGENKTWKELKDLKQGDLIFKLSQTEEDKFIQPTCITSIIEKNEEEVFDITIENAHNFIANGLVVHNSMACPAVAGIAALVISYHKKGLGAEDPIKTPEDVREHIRKICVDLGQAGKDVEYGNGMPVFGHMNVAPVVKKTWYQILWERIYGLWH